MSKPRVAFVTHFSPYYRLPLFELLAEELDVTFYFFSRGDEHYRGTLQHHPGSLPVRELRNVSVAGNPFLPGLSRELKRERYDAVVKCINGRLMVPYVYRLAKRRRLPFVLWTGIWWHPRTAAHLLTRPLTESIYRGADALVAYGDHVAAHLRSAGVEGEKIFVAGQAIEAGPFAAVEPSFGEPPRVLYVGRLERSKGIAELLSAFAALDDPAARLRVVGSGELGGAVAAAAAQDDRIEPVGELAQADLPAELAAARCLVLPSVTTRRDREPWGLVINEAMAAGLPVVASEAVGAAAGGLVRDGRNGLIVPERNPAALASAIGTLTANAALARELGEAGRTDVAAFTYGRMATAFVEAIAHARRPGQRTATGSGTAPGSRGGA